MRCVIQCAGSKRQEAGTFRTADGQRVAFVANPGKAPVCAGILHAHPDDLSDRGGHTWRERVLAVNAEREDNPGLLSAGYLYRPKAYDCLLDRFGPERLFVLSAGWGLVRADFLLPDYDITFSTSAAAWKRRNRTRGFADLNAHDGSLEEETVFLGGKDYLPLFLRLTNVAAGRRVIVHNSSVPPDAPGCRVVRYPTKWKTNWHYDCARRIAVGDWNPG